MKILYIHQYFNTPDMGGGTRSYEIAKRLVEKGHDVHMITSRRDAPAKGWVSTVENGITVHWYGVSYSNKMNFTRRMLAFLVFSSATTLFVLRQRADIVFATSTPLTVAIPALAKRYLARTPYVFEVRDLWPELPIAMGALGNPVLRWAAKWLEKRAYFGAASIITLSPGMRDGVVKLGIAPERVSIAPNACDNAMFCVSSKDIKDFRHKREWLQDRPLVIYAGTLGRINKVSYLVDVAQEARKIDPEIRFLIVGDGEERTVIEKHARTLGVLNENLFMEPPMSKREVATLFGAADISCSLFMNLPEMRANSANKFFDSLASGTPVLLNYGGWQADIVNQHEAGLVVWQLPILSVAKEIAAKLVDKQWLETTGRNAKDLAETKFDRDAIVAQVIDVIELAGAVSSGPATE